MQIDALVTNLNTLTREQFAFLEDRNYLHLFSAAKTGCESLLTLTVEMRRELLAGLSKAHALIAQNLVEIKTLLQSEEAYQAQFIPGLQGLMQAAGLEPQPAEELLRVARTARTRINLELVDFSETIQSLHTLQNITCFIYQALDFQESDANEITRLQQRLVKMTAGYQGVVLMGLNAAPQAEDMHLAASLSAVMGVSLVNGAVRDLIA